MNPPSPNSAGRRRLLVVDAANCLYRAFFALPALRTRDGVPTNAVLGFVNMLNKAIREEAPDQVVVVFDAPGRGFRHELYADYKATRDAQPEDLSAQGPLVREIVDAYRLPVLEVPGVEADDVIATLATRAPAHWDVTILSTDKDLMQLVGERVELLDTMKDRHYRPPEVEARFGVPPERVLDVRALVGDPTDNIPGVRGIGEKGAAKLIREWGDLETLLAHAAEVPGKRAREALVAQAAQARLSKRLARLRTDLSLPFELEALPRCEPDRDRLRELFTRLEFSRLLGDLGGEPSAATARVGPGPVAIERVAGETDLTRLLDALARRERVVTIPVGGAESTLREEPLALAFALDAARAVYLPLGGGGLPVEPTLSRLAEALVGSRARPWSGNDTKKIQTFFGEHGLAPPPPAFDIEIAAFLLDPAAVRTTGALAARHLGRTVRDWTELAGRGARAVPAAELPPEELSRWAGEQVCAVLDLETPLAAAVARDGLRRLLEEIELPLTAVLARMERAGVRVDEAALDRLSVEYARELARIEGEIRALAGESFNVGSPKQLQRILFEKLKLPVVRRTKTGFSTDEAVLEQLAGLHELPARILAHRRLAKLKSTYVDALPPLVNPKTGRIHPTFHQTGAATGRLSCSNPNLQNIPIRTEEGVRIREAFIPAEERILLSADYSQVELRILAHFSGDSSLIDAFAVGEDIHRRTAAEVHGLRPEAVTTEQRARAKAVNFGIVYGSSAFGLAKQLGIATGEAQDTIDAYFARYRGVRGFLDETVKVARQEGYVRTLLGRRRYLPDLGSRNRALRQAAERMAVNTVIQGTAADLIKKAMVEIDAALDASVACMILQVHDELVFELREKDIQTAGERIRGCMEAVWPLRVPLRVELGTGRSWREAH